MRFAINVIIPIAIIENIGPPKKSIRRHTIANNAAQIIDMFFHEYLAFLSQIRPRIGCKTAEITPNEADMTPIARFETPSSKRYKDIKPIPMQKSIQNRP